MYNYCKSCDCKLWSIYSKQKGICPECKDIDLEAKDLEEVLDELLFSVNE